MTTRILMFSLMCLALVTVGDPIPPSTGSQRIQIQSEVHQEKAWRRDVVMVSSEGEITGDDGVVGEKASTDAINTVAQNARQLSVSASQSMDASMDYVYTYTNQIAPNCVQIALHLAPDTDASNLVGYVVKTETVGNIDHQWVHYNRTLELRPNRWVRYDVLGVEYEVKSEWVNWNTNGVSVTVGGKTWNGCHECTVERPAATRGEICLDLPNEIWGGPNGIDWGDMNLVDGDGVSYYSGFVTNGITGAVLYFDKGFLSTVPTGE